tara:strand:- start:8013 stop:8240 length:228 start_codon:yes stop_codon:yes gene_type:complete
MPQEHYEEYKKNIGLRDKHKIKAKKKRKNASNLPIVGSLDEWMAARHDSKAENHEKQAFESAENHAKALKKKYKL